MKTCSLFCPSDSGRRAVGLSPGAVVLGQTTYYPRFGFIMAHTRGIHWQHEIPGDPFMVMELTRGTLEGVSGTACYFPEFISISSSF